MKIDETVSSFRGVLEFIIAKKIRIQYLPLKHARSRVPFPSKTLVESSKDNLILTSNFIGNYIKQKYNLSKNQIEEIKNICLLLKSSPNPKSLKRLLSDCFRIYSIAMDASSKKAAFLSFWQLAETISLSNEVGRDTKIVSNRIKWHLDRTQLFGQSLEYTIKKIRDSRNDIVHRGIHNVDDEDISILKYLCDSAILWLIEIQGIFKTKYELNYYYKSKNINTKDIDQRLIEINSEKKVLKYIQSERK